MGRRTLRNTHQEAEEYLDACRQNQDVAWSCYYDGYVTSQTAATDKFEAYKCKAMDKLNEAGALFWSVCGPCGGFDAKRLVPPR
jgi:hypothetical protein